MSNKNEATREQARDILKKGIMDMSIPRLIQMSNYGLMGNIELSNESVCVQNVFNRIGYDEENDCMTFIVEECESPYGTVSFFIGSIVDISGCEDVDNPEEYLNINIQLDDETTIKINVLY